MLIKTEKRIRATSYQIDRAGPGENGSHAADTDILNCVRLFFYLLKY